MILTFTVFVDEGIVRVGLKGDCILMNNIDSQLFMCACYPFDTLLVRRLRERLKICAYPTCCDDH